MVLGTKAVLQRVGPLLTMLGKFGTVSSNLWPGLRDAGFAATMITPGLPQQ
jgi:hypothetical protein